MGDAATTRDLVGHFLMKICFQNSGNIGEKEQRPYHSPSLIFLTKVVLKEEQVLIKRSRYHRTTPLSALSPNGAFSFMRSVDFSFSIVYNSFESSQGKKRKRVVRHEKRAFGSRRTEKF